MALTFNRWVANHRTRSSDVFSSLCRPVVLASGLWAWEMDATMTTLRLHGTMHRTYALEDLNWSLTWTVPSGVSGNLNLAWNIRRYIDGVNPLTPESAQFGAGAQAAPTAWQPKQNTPSVTQVLTDPTFPTNLGGIEDWEDYYLDITRTGGTTLTGSAYIIAVEGYF